MRDFISSFPEDDQAFAREKIRDLSFCNRASGHPLDRTVESLMEILEENAISARLVEQACDLGYRIEITAADQEEPEICPQEGVVKIGGAGLSPAAMARSVYFTNEFRINLIRALRRIDQVENGIMPRYLRPDQALFYARVLQADQNAVLTHILYALRPVEPGLWRHLIGAPDGDIPARYAQGMGEILKQKGIDETALSDSDTDADERIRTLNAAFLLWYRDSDRISRCDRATLTRIDLEMQTARMAKLYNAQLTQTMAEGACRDFTEGTYLNDLTLSAIFSPLCQMVPDEINARHLAQIMCERDQIIVHNVGFRDAALARAIFPDA